MVKPVRRFAHRVQTFLFLDLHAGSEVAVAALAEGAAEAEGEGRADRLGAGWASLGSGSFEHPRRSSDERAAPTRGAPQSRTVCQAITCRIYPLSAEALTLVAHHAYLASFSALGRPGRVVS